VRDIEWLEVGLGTAILLTSVSRFQAKRGARGSFASPNTKTTIFVFFTI
jgi:hypothetical protein